MWKEAQLEQRSNIFLTKISVVPQKSLKSVFDYKKLAAFLLLFYTHTRIFAIFFKYIHVLYYIVLFFWHNTVSLNK